MLHFLKYTTVFVYFSFTRNLPAPLRDAIHPRQWKKLYTQHDVDSALSKVKLVGFSEKLVCRNLMIVFSLSSVNYIAASTLMLPNVESYSLDELVSLA